ncbi:bifunctional hydroxymethylpyrimidine kinase/phosphomethylpyrimidine kinase [Paenalcaligenes niemegkensis]|uniref:bifunctional hydroxymethylpyrimidine kinase/phosphomethylpyrimidine kinase n=1 Tax=Paenalcaligenes niemegkensis TaxID=2895469 RepID=UPI001EE7A7BB|nr:bifunctional hydroxymethylpyrimidine kinase/phosphomethylpyrimidine kinase [Paenalcaligenes niemegkensis]MCQ9615537.1 bifunctional hydroxymethylpyrimidine kinase/phosphomethylpyrimidine kinase [Paenalcaligenes niemegkensis]
MIPSTLTIAGVDPSGGAGVLADVKAMSALGAYANAVIAALTAQNTQGLTGISPVDPDFIKLQIDTLFNDVRIDAVKIGMLGQQPVIRVVSDSLAHWKPKHIVLDPVMVAKSGDHLLEKAAINEMRESLLPQSTMMTPNLPEAGVLIERRPAETVKEMYGTAEKLHRLFDHNDERWVFLKGGHLPGKECTDLLYNGDRMIEMPALRIDTKNTHGTGCTLSAALAALLPQTADPVEAAKAAKQYLYKAIARSHELDIGSGHGPVHHFHQWWKPLSK